MLEAPHHNVTSPSISGCLDCHDLTAVGWPKFIPEPYPGYVPRDPAVLENENTPFNLKCWECHSGTTVTAGGTPVTLENMATHSSLTMGSTKYGEWAVGCTVCHNAHSQGGQPGRKFIWNFARLDQIEVYGGKTPKSGKKTIVFNGPTGPNSFADGDGTYDGICEVCHTQTKYFRNDGSGSDQNHGGRNGSNCMLCHNHVNGFAHGGGGDNTDCASCHNTASHSQHLSLDNNCFHCHDQENMRDGDGNIVDPRLGTACDACHQDGRGGPPNQTDYKANWANASYDLSCDGCHNGRPSLDTLVMANDGHDRLVGEAGIRQYPCYYCHAETVDSSWNLLARHADGSRDVAVDEQWEIVDQTPPAEPHYDPDTQVCTNIYCHTDGTTVDPEMRPYPWSGGAQSCNSCHGHDPSKTDCTSCHTGSMAWESEQEWLSAMPMYANTGPGTSRANSHFRHLFTGFDCDDCHADTVVGACLTCHTDANGNPVIPSGQMTDIAHVNGAYHVNKEKTVVFKDGGTYDIASKTCSSTACHSGANPVWGDSVNNAITCLECHGTTGADVDDFGVFNGSQAKINLSQWTITGHGRTAGSGNYDSGNPPASFPGIGCWYCHDNQVLHQVDEDPFRLRRHEHFQNRFQKECVYCHMVGEDEECLSCHDSTSSLAPQMADIDAQPGTINPPYTIERPDHNGYTGGCASTTCHVNDDTRHRSGSPLWSADQKHDVQNNYMQMGVCLKCHDDDSGGQCTSCHAAPADNPATPEDESLKYATGFDPGLPGTTYIKPQRARASSVHFGYKHYIGYEDSITTSLDSGIVSTSAGSATEFTDGAKSWTDNQWTGYWVRMIDGGSGDETRRIKNNTAISLTLEEGFTSAVQAGEQYEILDPVWKGGKFCWDCHDPHGDANIFMIHDKVATRTDGIYGRPVTRADVVFTRNQSGQDYARISAPFNGICNICHTAGSQHYAADRGDGHNAGRICTTCHEHRFTDSHSSGRTCDSCHQNKPVPRHSSFGLPRDCTKCHQGAIGKRMDIMGQFSANSHHIQRPDGTIKNTDCYQCHWESTDNGLIDVDYHQGYNYKNHASVKNGDVDLVIWNGEETPGGVYDDTDPALGSRPVVYDLDGTNPDGPGMATVTRFLAANMDTTQAGVTLVDQRGEVDKITLHCLGCHSDQNNDSQPFGDCKVPRQYAWDGSSIDARYSDTGSATWGKYIGNAAAAQKNVAKAFSAHGNAVAGGGGWSATTGVDGAISNTRAGAYNVQCFDCHSSHGSKVAGITSSYITFNGTRNGANLKETQAGKGGYAMSYKASANPDPNSVNPYNAGAGQCFDCHETATSGSTPWGYNETFGATAPVIGYRDNARFSGSYPGQRFAYRNSMATLGGHLNASSDLTTPAMYSIDGLCSPCHDPHGVSPSLGGKKEYAVPLLKGTFMTSPYKEDFPQDDTNNSERYTGQKVNWATDRNTFGGGAVSEDEDLFSGLCLRCHPKDHLTDGIDKNTSFKTVDRIHETVKGWGSNAEHNFTCAKCHQPHASGLPRLMATNCLNGSHRGLVESGGVPYQRSVGSRGGRFPIGSKHLGGLWDGSFGCHDSPAAAGSPWNVQDWNNVTPW
ncbi:MAG: CxxxxCH/CxxCH domain-containing protein [Desulfobulbaceae bacterium]|nr:CxxxxCH/CxxCH domain-containing protein [Desulfobulbaceae bacterium]